MTPTMKTGSNEYTAVTPTQKTGNSDYAATTPTMKTGGNAKTSEVSIFIISMCYNVGLVFKFNPFGKMKDGQFCGVFNVKKKLHAFL